MFEKQYNACEKYVQKNFSLNKQLLKFIKIKNNFFAPNSFQGESTLLTLKRKFRSISTSLNKDLIKANDLKVRMWLEDTKTLLFPFPEKIYSNQIKLFFYDKNQLAIKLPIIKKTLTEFENIKLCLIYTKTKQKNGKSLVIVLYKNEINEVYTFTLNIESIKTSIEPIQLNTIKQIINKISEIDDTLGSILAETNPEKFSNDSFFLGCYRSLSSCYKRHTVLVNHILYQYNDRRNFYTLIARVNAYFGSVTKINQQLAKIHSKNKQFVTQIAKVQKLLEQLQLINLNENLLQNINQQHKTYQKLKRTYTSRNNLNIINITSAKHLKLLCEDFISTKIIDHKKIITYLNLCPNFWDQQKQIAFQYILEYLYMSNKKKGQLMQAIENA